MFLQARRIVHGWQPDLAVVVRTSVRPLRVRTELLANKIGNPLGAGEVQSSFEPK